MLNEQLISGQYDGSVMQECTTVSMLSELTRHSLTQH